MMRIAVSGVAREILLCLLDNNDRFVIQNIFRKKSWPPVMERVEDYDGLVGAGHDGFGDGN